MFLTGTTNIVAGNGENFILDYNELASLAGTFDSYFAEKAVIKDVLCLYQESSFVGSRPQRKTLSFKDGATTSQIVFSVKANPGTWVLKEVLIQDKDGGSLLINDSQIPNLASYELYITNV